MSRLYKSFKKYHKWLGVVLAIFFMLFALSGIVLNHRSLFSGIDIPRNWLPKEYRYNNWNNAAIKGATPIGADSLLLYGNVGVWLTDNTFSYFTDFNKGFKKGIDNRKISDLIYTSTQELFAATQFGLFQFNRTEKQWEAVRLPIKEERIVALEEKGDSLLVMSRSYILLAKGSEDYSNFTTIDLLSPKDASGRVGLFRTVWLIHSGEIWGNIGKIIVDIGGIAMFTLSLTGFIYFIAPSLLKRIAKKRQRTRSRLKRINRRSYKWHLQLGIITALLLLLISVTGIFLRPPLLIPIANSTVKPIKGTTLDSPNHWNDKLRDLLYDDQKNVMVLGTSEGLYLAPPDFSEPPFKMPLQPPLSIMGINVLWNNGDGYYAVGSFNGMFLWNPYRLEVLNYMTGLEYQAHGGFRNPFGAQPIAGGITISQERTILFDYNAGSFSPFGDNPMPPMPQEIIDKSGISLWNFAQEIHTWRILNFLIGDFYILVVPIAGISALIVVISGAVMWLIKLIQKRKRKKEEN